MNFFSLFIFFLTITVYDNTQGVCIPINYLLRKLKVNTTQNQQDGNTEQNHIPSQQPKEDAFEPSTPEGQNNDAAAQNKTQENQTDSTVAS